MHPGAVRTALLEFTACHRLLELKHCRAGLRHVDVDRIELLDGREGRRLAGCNQCTRRDRRLADTARDRRIDGRVGEIDAARLEIGLGRSDIGLALL
ncbi:hypothetical protein D9M68_774080 [compost metagenome]